MRWPSSDPSRNESLRQGEFNLDHLKGLHMISYVCYF